VLFVTLIRGPGSARYLRHLGFEALATTSSGFAFSAGSDLDTAVPRDHMLVYTGHVSAVEVPRND
jgi:2-methylisocitrate lyase-like PEP mutase family enzyme